MKRGLLIMGIIISLTGVAQPSIKLYGYSQIAMPGMVPQRDIPGENGERRINTPNASTHYYVYTRTSVSIQPVEIWVGGKWYAATGTLIRLTPVLADHPEKKTLVPFTKLKVQRIEPQDTLKNTLAISSSLKKLMNANELIVAYKWKGKKYYAVQKKLTVLEPIHAQ